MLRKLWRRRQPKPNLRWELEQTILSLTPHDHWTIADACMGCQVWGSTGSGKTTGILANKILAFLAADFGGIFFTNKPTDAQMYFQLCKKMRREGDVIMFGPSHPHRFNALGAELRRDDAGAGQTQSVVTLLTTLLEVSERSSRRGGGDDSSYWQRANIQLTRNLVDLLVMAKNRLSIPELYKVLISAPTSYEQLASADWRKSSLCCQCLDEADKRTVDPIKRRDLDLVADYLCVEWPGLSDRTRSVVMSTFTSMVDVLNRGIVRELISTTTDVRPEMIQDGKIFIIDAPTMIFGEQGVFLQVLWKYCTQRAQERRDIDSNPRPAFLVSDESHLIAVKQDQVFQTTARSSRTAVLNGTQSISNYMAVLGEHSESLVFSLVGCLQTQYFAQQADVKSNAYAAELIGRTLQYMFSSNSSYQSNDWIASALGLQSNQTTSAGMNQVYEYEVQPQVFAALRKGGPPTWQVDAIVYQGGRSFSQTGRAWSPVTFKQQF